MITSGHGRLPLGRGPCALHCPGAYNAVKTVLAVTLFLKESVRGFLYSIIRYNEDVKVLTSLTKHSGCAHVRSP